MTAESKSSRIRSNRRRRRNALRAVLSPLICCFTSTPKQQRDMTSNFGLSSSTSSRQDKRDQQKHHVEQSQILGRDHDATEFKEQNDDVHPETATELENSPRTMADVTILEWSRLSNVYRHGLPITLGEGDEGYVQLMRDNQTNQLVAVKTWHKEPHTDVSMMNDVFNYELAAMKKFNGVKYFPKLIGIVPNADSAVSFSLVQEFIGDIRSKRTLSLLDAIHDNELMYQEIVSAALEVSEALAEMHRNGWVHCDVKTDNVILKTDSVLQETDVGSDNGWWINEPPTNSSGSLHAKLIDFGGARPISEAKLPKKLPKKMKKYMYEMCPQIAPEVVEGLGKVPYSFESDVYSFGRLLKDISELSGSVELDQLADRCLAKSPKKRPNIDSVVDELKKLQ